MDLRDPIPQLGYVVGEQISSFEEPASGDLTVTYIDHSSTVVVTGTYHEGRTFLYGTFTDENGTQFLYNHKYFLDVLKVFDEQSRHSVRTYRLLQANCWETPWF